MSDWGEEDGYWPVKYPVEATPRQAGRRFQEDPAPRWTGTGKPDTRELRKRLLWLLLAFEIGMALVAGCVLPLLFLKPPVLAEGAHVLGLSSRTVCLVIALPIPIVLLTLGVSLWWSRWIRASEV